MYPPAHRFLIIFTGLGAGLHRISTPGDLTLGRSEEVGGRTSLPTEKKGLVGFMRVLRSLRIMDLLEDLL
jgi:hypothetical protein